MVQDDPVDGIQGEDAARDGLHAPSARSGARDAGSAAQADDVGSSSARRVRFDGAAIAVPHSAGNSDFSASESSANRKDSFAKLLSIMQQRSGGRGGPPAPPPSRRQQRPTRRSRAPGSSALAGRE